MVARVLWREQSQGRITSELVDGVLRLTSYGKEPPPPPPRDDVTQIDWWCPRGTAWDITHYVTPGGDDTKNGTSRASAWKTLSKANSEAAAGMVIQIDAGTYTGRIAPGADGTEDSPIVYIANGSVTIKDNYTMLNLERCEYILVEGFDFEPDPMGAWNWATVGDSSWCCVRDCAFDSGKTGKQAWGGRSGWNNSRAMVVGGADHLWLDSCDFSGYFLGPSFHSDCSKVFVSDCTFKQGGKQGSTFNAGSTEGNYMGVLFYRCFWDYVHTADNVQFVGTDLYTTVQYRGVIFKQCVFARAGENAIDFKNTEHIVVDQCIAYGNIGAEAGWEGEAAHIEDCKPVFTVGNMNAVVDGFKRFRAYNILIRKTVIWDATQAMVFPWEWRHVHNTCVGNNRSYDGPDQSYDKLGNVIGTVAFRQIAKHSGQAIINCIVAGQNHIQGSLLDRNQPGLRVNHNCYYDTRALKFAAVGSSSWGSKTFSQWKTMLAGNGVEGADAQSITDNPQFKDCPIRPDYESGDHVTRDFRIKEGSPCENAAGPITLTASAGSGQWVEVADANLFCDGFGIAWGDVIQIGDGDWNRIIDIDYGANKLKLSSAQSWGENDPVHYEYAGQGPDIGALGPDDEKWWEDI